MENFRQCIIKTIIGYNDYNETINRGYNRYFNNYYKDYYNDF